MSDGVKKDFTEADPRFMASLARGLDVLRAFEGHTSLTVTQAANATGLSRSAAGRCLFTLERLGYAAAREGKYSLTQAVLPLARAFTAADPLSRAGQPVVDALRDRLGESSSLAMFDPRYGHANVLYVCRAEAARIISVPLLAGSTLPSYCTSNGRVLLAGLEPPSLHAFLARAPFPARTALTLTTAEALHEEIESVRTNGWALCSSARARPRGGGESRAQSRHPVQPACIGLAHRHGPPGTAGRRRSSRPHHGKLTWHSRSIWPRLSSPSQRDRQAFLWFPRDRRWAPTVRRPSEPNAPIWEDQLAARGRASINASSSTAERAVPNR